MGVEAGRDQHPAGAEAVDERGDDLVERPEVHVAGRARGKREVARRARSPRRGRCRGAGRCRDRAATRATRRNRRSGSRRRCPGCRCRGARRSRRRSTRSPRAASAAAVTATLLSRQKPIGTRSVAWWPGGRTARNAASPSPRSSASAAASPAPAARTRRRPRARRDDGVGVEVAAAVRADLARAWSSIAGECTRSSSARVASRGSRATSASSIPAASIPAATACRRADPFGVARTGVVRRELRVGTEHQHRGEGTRGGGPGPRLGTAPHDPMVVTGQGCRVAGGGHSVRSSAVAARSVRETARETVRWRGGWARIGPVAGQPRDRPRRRRHRDSPRRPRRVLDDCLDRLRALGYENAVTNAMPPQGLAGLRRRRLRGPRAPPPPRAPRRRRARRGPRAAADPPGPALGPGRRARARLPRLSARSGSSNPRGSTTRSTRPPTAPASGSG